MTTVDSSYRRILAIAMPVVIGEVSYGLMGVVDTAMVGQLGVAPLAAVGLANMIYFWPTSFFFGLLAATNTTIAQAVGAGQFRRAGQEFWQGCYLGVFSTLGLLLCIPLVPLVFRAIGPTPEVQQMAGEYMVIRLWGSGGMMLLVVAEYFHKGLGQTRPLMWASLSLTGLNCVLNFGLIYGELGMPALGTAGAAWGSVIAHTLVSSVLFGSLFVRSDLARFQLARGRGFVKERFMRLLRVGVPVGVQGFVEMGGIAVFMAAVARIGDAEMAATNAVIQSWNVAYMFNFALSMAATTLVGQCVGAGQSAQVRPVMFRTMVVGYGGIGLFVLIFLSVPELLMGVFVDAEGFSALQPFARPLFTILAASVLCGLPFTVLSGGLRGAGDTTYSMLVTAGATWLLLAPGAWWAAQTLGLYGAWCMLFAYVAVGALLMVLRVRSAGWLRAAVQQAQAELATPAHS